MPPATIQQHPGFPTLPCRVFDLFEIDFRSGASILFRPEEAFLASDAATFRKLSQVLLPDTMRKATLIRPISILAFTAPLLVFETHASNQEQLADSRGQIDTIDQQVVTLINQRAAIVKKIGQIKAAAGLPISVPSREQQVLERVSRNGSAGPLPVSRLRTIYSTLLQQMRDWEEEQQNTTIRSQTLLQSSASWNGVEYTSYPSGVPELSVLKMTIPPHQELRWHIHPMPNVGFVLSGEITAEEPNGKQKHFSAGDAIPETVDTVHRGRTGDQTAVLLVFYAGVKGMPLAQDKRP